VSSRTLYQNTDQRVGIFVDVQNMFYSAKSLHQSKIDYSKLLEDIVRGRKLVRAIAYVVQKPDIDQSGFLEALRRSGYEVKKKDLVVREDGTSKGDWNVGIALDAMALASKLDTAILVTGDGDFVPLAHMLKTMGCRVEVVSFEQCTSSELMRACDEFMTIDTGVLFKEEKFVRDRNALPYNPDLRVAEASRESYPGHYDPDE